MKYSLSDSEAFIMEVLWEIDREIRAGELYELLLERGQDWKRQTMNTFLTRMEEKDAIRRKWGYVAAKYTPEEYKHQQCREWIRVNYDNSLMKLVSSYAGSKKLTAKETATLQRLIQKVEEE